MPVPANFQIDLEFQDNRGFRSNLALNLYQPDISASGTTEALRYTFVIGVATAMAAMSNSKLVRIGFRNTFDYAQEPSSETGTYQLVTQKAKLNGGDGNGGFQRMSVPAPKDGLFLSVNSDKLVTVDPASALLTAMQTSLAAANNLPTTRGGVAFSQFFGGQYIGGKARRRRVLAGQ